jgi:hypothetical protein
MNSELLNEILKLCVSAVAVTIIPVAVAVGRAYAHKIEMDLMGSQYAMVGTIAKDAVRYAEQSGLEQEIKKTGEEKFNLALKYTQAEMDKRNIPIAVYPLAEIIKSQVMEQFNK